MKTTITKEGRVWRWEIKRGRKVLFGGYCKTKKDATNDAGVVMRQNKELSCGESSSRKAQTAGWKE